MVAEPMFPLAPTMAILRPGRLDILFQIGTRVPVGMEC